MSDPKPHVLVIAPADSPFLGLDMRGRFVIAHASAPEDAMQKLERHAPVAVLVELTSPDETKWSLFDRIQLAKPEIPILVLSRKEEEDVAIRALRDGAQDYLVRDGLDASELSRAIQFALERHRMVRERQASLERLRELERFKTEFINTAAHELNSPLTPVKVQLHLLQKGSLDEKQQHSLAIADRNVDRLIGLVADILDAARLQADRLMIRKEPVDLHRIVKDAVESLGEVARRQKVKLSSATKPGLMVEADPDRINQVVYNLINNALKFTPEGGRISVSAAPEGEVAVIRVQDTGIGLRKEDFPRLFQPFSQAHEWTATKKPGSGLGLYICQGIVEQHGGRIWVDSPGPNRGATFSFALPLPGPEMTQVVTAPRAKKGAVRKSAFWPILYFKCPTCGSHDIDMRILKNKYECRACTDEWR